MQASLNGPELSELIQGYWRVSEWSLSPQERLTFLKQHVDLGITTVDHADIYGDYSCEQLFGEALRLDRSIRNRIEIVTKCNIKLLSEKHPGRKVKYYDSSADHIRHSVDNSLSRLGVEHIDILLLHRPDMLMDADEVASVFTELEKAGKVKHFGVSNFTPYQFDLLQSRLSSPLVTNQVEINPVNFSVAEDGTLDQLQQYRVHPMAWSCLAGGEIFTRSDTQAERIRVTLDGIKEEVGAANIDQVIYAWVRRFPSKPLAIVGSGSIERVKSAIESLKLNLSREQWYKIWTAAKGCEVP
ncbi:aldo/keto reductase [Microbulbifer sp. VAAF005]|uniref:aldo/keto reductase n=1 Tax=Microbulbifer sp. VAAF005 TaxID=3034230 RepID=UPI0024AE433C|nr:aldo/keto reductase [Microbulbifer sp. VAAF005]WHI47085.1 aldo/keto reductase [Microbulbifer sp. VAAF005]